ncbi:hypothetical protein L218DRAFT_941724 [Marasmius fiardii PR-910]|nr:hypothetical protein L218DRAFT_941724 [Marasmius fiardii PR-910]
MLASFSDELSISPCVSVDLPRPSPPFTQGGVGFVDLRFVENFFGNYNLPDAAIDGRKKVIDSLFVESPLISHEVPIASFVLEGEGDGQGASCPDRGVMAGVELGLSLGGLNVLFKGSVKGHRKETFGVPGLVPPSHYILGIIAIERPNWYTDLQQIPHALPIGPPTSLPGGGTLEFVQVVLVTIAQRGKMGTFQKSILIITLAPVQERPSTGSAGYKDLTLRYDTAGDGLGKSGTLISWVTPGDN